jgi:large subunit ribosomal protein LP1
MAHVEVSALSKVQRDELACTYAALLLHDGELEITEEKLNKVITASGNTVEGYWPGLFAKALKGKNIADLLSNAGASSGPAPAAAGPATDAPAAEKKKEEPKSKYLFHSFCDTWRALILARSLPGKNGVSESSSCRKQSSYLRFVCRGGRGRCRHG